MKAVTLNGYDGLASLKLETVPAPAFGARDVVIGVHAASMNPIDVKFAQGALRDRFDLSFPHVLGRDCAGIVLAVGSAVTEFDVGNNVCAIGDPLRWGTHAQQVAVDASTVAPKPEQLSYVEASAISLAGLSAVAGLVAVGDLQKGERVLIHGGAGGVGSLAIQLAKHLGAFVATTTRSENAEFVRTLGADVVVDHINEDFSRQLNDFDFVFDIVGGDVRFESFNVLRKGGRIVHLSTPAMKQPPPRDDVIVKQAQVSYQTEALNGLMKLVVGQAIRPVVGNVFVYEEAVKAYESMMTPGTTGKIVIEMPGPR